LILEKLEASNDVLHDKLELLKQLMPEVFSEGKFDYDKFKGLFVEEIDERPERYSFSWAGRREATRLLQAKSRAALVPAKEESVNFDDTKNIFIEGDNLEVLKLLRNSYFSRVKMIYIDPPYNTSNDFVYPDDFRDPLLVYRQITGQIDENGNALTTDSDNNGRRHSKWITMMYPRLFIARQLLREDGAIFISIDENEVHNLRIILNEIFGEENFVAQITTLCNPKGRSQDKYFATNHEYILIYSKAPLPKGYFSLDKDEEQIADEYPEEDETGKYRLLELRNTHREFGKHNRPRLFYPIYVNPQTGEISFKAIEDYIKVSPIWEDGFEGCWTWEKPKAIREVDFLEVKKNANGQWKVFRKSYATGAEKMLKTIFNDKLFYTEKGQASFSELFLTKSKIFQSPKSVDLIKQLIQTITNSGDIILDFFAGSATTAHVVLQLNIEEITNRKFILVQLPEMTKKGSEAYKAGFSNICEIGKERIRRAIAKLNEEHSSDNQNSTDLGFKVFKLDESHWKQWDGVEEDSPAAYIRQMEMFADPLIEGWKAENLIYEVAVKEGLSLNIRIDKVKDIEANDIYYVTDPEMERGFYVCLDDKVSMEAMASLKLTLDDSFICRAIALDDTTAANIDLQCCLKTI